MTDKKGRDRKKQEEALDEALEETFPASDTPSQLMPHQSEEDKKHSDKQ